MTEHLITCPEAAAIMGVTRARVAFLCRRGDLPGARQVGRQWVIPEAAARAYRPRPPGRPWPKHTP